MVKYHIIFCENNGEELWDFELRAKVGTDISRVLYFSIMKEE